MSCWRGLLTCPLVAAALMLAPGSALADSAGDQQYVDPLGGTQPTPKHHHSSPPPPSSSSSTPTTSAAPPPTTSSTTTIASTRATTTATTASTSTSTSSHSSSRGADPSGTLPFTGFDIWPSLALGLGLVGSGFALRRTVRRD